MPLNWTTPPDRSKVAAHLREGREAFLQSGRADIAYVVKLSADRQQWRARRLRYGVAEGERTDTFASDDGADQVEAALAQWHQAFFGATP